MNEQELKRLIHSHGVSRKLVETLPSLKPGIHPVEIVDDAGRTVRFRVARLSRVGNQLYLERGDEVTDANKSEESPLDSQSPFGPRDHEWSVDTRKADALSGVFRWLAAVVLIAILVLRAGEPIEPIDRMLACIAGAVLSLDLVLVFLRWQIEGRIRIGKDWIDRLVSLAFAAFAVRYLINVL